MNKSSRCKMAWAVGAILLAGLVYSWAPATADDEPPQPAPPPAPPAPPAPPSPAADAFQNFNMEMNKAFHRMYGASDALGKLQTKLTDTLDSAQLKALVDEARQQLSKIYQDFDIVYKALDNARQCLPTRTETRLIKVEHADVIQVAKLMLVFEASGCQVAPNPELRALLVSGPEDAVEQIEKAVQVLDKPKGPEPPKKNLELLVYILEGHADPFPNATVPEALQDVTVELSRTFPYPSFVLLDTLLLRCRDGEGTELNTPISGEGRNGEQKLTVGSISVTSEGPQTTIRLNEFRYGATIVTLPPPLPAEPPVVEGQPQPRRPARVSDSKSVGFTANLDVQEDQKVVVGKANMGNANTSMFVVVTARVVDTAPAAPPPAPPAATPR